MKKVRLIAVIAAAIAALGIFLFLKEISKPAETPRTRIVVAAVDIAENTLITEDMVELRPVATEALLYNYLLDVESAVGKVAKSDIFAGEQVTKNRLVLTGGPDDDSNTLAYVLKDGMRAVTISVNTISGLENMIKPGNHVDLVGVYTYEVPKEDKSDDKETADENDVGSESEKKDDDKEKITTAQLLEQDLNVLAVGSVMSKEGAAEYVTITLEVTPEQAVRLSYESSTCSLRAVLRSPLDDTILDPFEYGMEDLRGEVEEP